jgi:hypothetical protein
MKIRPVGAGLFHADRQMDRQEANSSFINFWKAPETNLAEYNKIPKGHLN